MENRRRAERQPAVWMGACRVEGDAADAWRDCGVFDFSALGAGVDLRHAEPSGLVGRRVSLRLPVGASTEFRVTGEVRNAKAGPEDVVRAGIEFAGLSALERSVLEVLERGAVYEPRD